MFLEFWIVVILTYCARSPLSCFVHSGYILSLIIICINLTLLDLKFIAWSISSSFRIGSHLFVSSGLKGMLKRCTTSWHRGAMWMLLIVYGDVFHLPWCGLMDGTRARYGFHRANGVCYLYFPYVLLKKMFNQNIFVVNSFHGCFLSWYVFFIIFRVWFIW